VNANFSTLAFDQRGCFEKGMSHDDAVADIAAKSRHFINAYEKG